MTSKKLLVIGSLSLVVAISAGALAFRSALTRARSMQAHSCAASIYAALEATNHLGTTVQASAEGEWQILNASECDQLIMKISRSHPIDAGKDRWLPNGTLVDPWKSRYQIALRRLSSGNVEYVVWSNGPDGISRTTDDVAVPNGTHVP